ncbi:ribosome biogenesis GTPase Der [Desulforamulus aeronauticus]|uniref:GTPase Der n=1 Tax=Desulforamulus aeronauticus DSM 10349 TaxID=1121421 RepID=A0A1M6SSZ5_9FIRM|nr:ribosome biogenesis GTPase Der [Desulforamulus aeronauticus]SHK47767.1 GTP-binding protein [Desulforamulus aeronauticus DSM 10349]
MPKPIIAIVGRPNVGKSSLFNRIAGGRIAIVEDMPGVTRDRLYQDAEWQGREFTLVDTGGLDFAEDIITSQIRKQAEMAIAEADAILFVVDARQGITIIDEEVAKTLRRADKPVLLVANKVEHFDKIPYYEFYQLGLGEPIPVSAAEGLNTGDLLDTLVSILPQPEEDPYPPDTIRIAVIGRPNVGKSSMVNAILGEERVIVSNIPGTTRDAIDSPFEQNGKSYVIVDTAGMRRRNRIDVPAERYSVVRALRAVDRSDVVLMVFDATEDIAEQDKKIVGYAHDKGKAIILVMNKWDLIEKDDKTMNKFEKKLKAELAFLPYAPTIFVSALTKQRLPKILELVDFVAEEASKRVATADLNNLIRDAVQATPPPADKHRRLKIFYATQGGVKPPTFILFVNDPELMHFSYQRYLENKIRQTYGFEGTPIRIFLRQREARDE